MAQDIAELGIRVDARQVRQGESALDNLVRTGRRAENQMDSIGGVVKSLGAGLAGLALIAKAIDFGSAMVNAQRDFDKLNASLITATGSAGAAGQAFAALQRFAANTPYGLQETTKAFIQLRNLGLTPSERALTAYGNTAAAMGKDLSQLVEAVADATTGEFERLKEFGIKAKQEGDRVALTFQGTTTTVANNAQAIEQYLMRLGEINFAGGMELRAKTLDGAISGLADTWDATLLAFSQSGFGEAALSSVLALSGALTDLQAIVRSFSGELDAGGKKVEEYGLLHDTLTEIFTVGAVVAANTAYVFKAVGKDIGAFAATIVALARGDWDEAKRIAGMRKADAEEERQMIDAQTEKIRWAAAVARKVRENESEEKQREQRDDLARFGIAREAVTQKSAAQKKAADDAAKWYAQTVRAGADELAMLRAERDAVEALTPAQRDALKVRQDMARIAALLTPKQREMVEAQLAEKIAIEQVTQEREHYVELLQKGFAASSSEVSAAEARVEALKQEVEHYGLAEDAVLRLTLAELNRKMAATDDAAEQDRLFRLIAATEDQLELQTKLTKLKANTDFWKDLDDTARQTFRSIEDGGKGIWQRIKESAKNVFFDWLYQMTAKKWIVNLQANASASGGGDMLSSLASIFGGFGGGSSGSGGSLGIMDMVSMGKNLYSAFTGGLASSMGGVIADLGVTFGSSALQGFGMGMGMTTAQASAGAAVASGAGNAAGAAGVSAGAGFANAIPVIGWIISGMMASNSLYKQGWDFNNGSVNKLGQNLGSGINLVDQLARKLGFSNSTANIISGLAPVSKLFGRKNPEITEQGLTGSLSAGGFTGEMYANILEKGGVFRSDKRYTRKAGLTTEQEAGFDNSMLAIAASVKGFGEMLGLQTSVIDGYSKQIKLVLSNDEAKNQEAIAAMFSGVADDLAGMVLPGLSRLSAEGETLATTLQRVAGDVVNVNAIMQALGVDASKAFGAIGLASIEARERLIALAGGVDALATMSNFFQQNFLTEAERMAPVQKAVAEQMAALGYASVKTNDQFKALVLGLANSGTLATEAGSKTYAQLLALAPQFKAVADYVKQIEDTRAAEELAKLTAAQQAAQESARSSLSDFIGKMQDFATSVASINDSLVLGDLSNLTPEQQYAEARRQFEQTRQLAYAGDETARSNLESVEQAFLQISQRINGGDAQYSSDLATVMQTNDYLAQWATDSVDVAQASLDALLGNSATLESINGILQAIATGTPVAGTTRPTTTAQAFAPVEFSSSSAFSYAEVVAELRAVHEELAKLRADAERQTGAQITATVVAADQAADKINAGTRSAMVDGAWQAENATRVPV
ncbi:hypothetical protein [Massilia sp. METH4]|uniref:hypothetical protein n=1 Tax=Massilia sp. METH4 TaxID=3123041 RepID=UPI0030CF4D91